ncbi:MAG: hypothetical protein ACYC35_24505 [Pirellulales bacterium]
MSKLDRKLGRFAVPNVTLYLIAGQVLVYLASAGKPEVAANVTLVPRLVLEGQVWRLVAFLLDPPFTNPFFAFFFWYLFYLMGSALEAQWGAFRYNVYLLIGFAATVGVSFLVPDLPSSNKFLQLSVFLAFAQLYPDFVLQLFFILPVKIKWLALLTWIGYFFALVAGGWLDRLLVTASVVNFVLFFGKEIVWRIRSGHRRITKQAERFTAPDEPFHRCTVCGITDRTHPKMDFRYCSKCDGRWGYCTEHLRNHEHLTKDRQPVKSETAES